MRIVYLHGFASSPRSKKAQFFAHKFAGRGIPFTPLDLEEGNFEGLTLSSQLSVVARALSQIQTESAPPAVLMGSSLGGYLSGLYAARHPRQVEKLVLLAPAFQFPQRWRQRFGERNLALWKQAGSVGFFHYGYQQDRRLGWQFIEDAAQYENEPDFHQPALLLHGSRDETVPSEVSEQFAASHPNATLKLFDSGHELTDVLDQLWRETAAFLGIPILIGE